MYFSTISSAIFELWSLELSSIRIISWNRFVSINFVTDRDLDYQNEIMGYYDTKIEEMPQNINDYLNI